MREHSRLIAFIGAFLALSCFTLPWITFTKGSYKMTYETNVRTGRVGGAKFRSSTPVTETGSITKQFPTTHHRYPGYRIAMKWNLVTIAVIESILILICSIILLAKNSSGRLKRIVIISSVIALLCLLISFLLVTVFSENGLRSMGNTTYTAAGEIQFGGFGAAAGFVIVFVGASYIPKENVAARIIGELK